MADYKTMHHLNALGRFYVDDGCAGCNLCISTAPRHFKKDDGEAKRAYVFRQPETPAEIGSCLEAYLICPVNAIGDLEAER